MAKKGAVYITKTVLFPARFLYLEKTGEIAGNDASYQYYVDSFTGDDADLVNSGYQWRLHGLPEDLDSVTKKLNKGLVSLYHNFIDIYAGRMESYGQHELKQKLMQWRENITI